MHAYAALERIFYKVKSDADSVVNEGPDSPPSPMRLPMSTSTGMAGRPTVLLQGHG